MCSILTVMASLKPSVNGQPCRTASSLLEYMSNQADGDIEKRRAILDAERALEFAGHLQVERNRQNKSCVSALLETRLWRALDKAGLTDEQRLEW